MLDSGNAVKYDVIFKYSPRPQDVFLNLIAVWKLPGFKKALSPELQKFAARNPDEVLLKPMAMTKSMIEYVRFVVAEDEDIDDEDMKQVKMLGFKSGWWHKVEGDHLVPYKKRISSKG
jgi:hypothetical protein